MSGPESAATPMRGQAVTGVCRPCREGDHRSHRGYGWVWICISCPCDWTPNKIDEAP